MSKNIPKNSVVRSWLWDHDEKVVENGVTLWRCRHCRQSTAAKYSTKGGASQRYHLKTVHGIVDDEKIPTNQTTLEASMQPSISSRALRKAMIKWMIDRRHPFSEVEADSFRNIIALIDKAAVSKLPHSGNTMRAEILRYFKGAKPIIAELLSTAQSRIHLSFDLSTSPNYKALLAITAHWTSVEYTERIFEDLSYTKGLLQSHENMASQSFVI